MSPLTPSPLTLKPAPQRHPRRGFSLVELMVVIAIIGVLVALILPGLFSAGQGVRNAEVATEIKGLEQGITEFKLQYGQEPPSGITLFEEGGAWDTPSTVMIRSMWPQFDFTIDRDLDQDTNFGESDPDGDGANGIRLTGDECLVFFLGGSGTIAPAGSAVANGFSSNPSDPFASDGNRVGPFFTDFDPDRFIDIVETGGIQDGAHSYNDAYPSTEVPYLYLSSYDGRGYRPQNDADVDNDGTPQLFTSIDDDENGTQEAIGYSVYMQKDPDYERPSDLDNTRESGEVAWKENSFQIISAGPDGIFGCPGIWSSEDGISHRTPAPPAPDPVVLPKRVLNFREASDNVTNFSGGTLGN